MVFQPSSAQMSDKYRLPALLYHSYNFPPQTCGIHSLRQDLGQVFDHRYFDNPELWAELELLPLGNLPAGALGKVKVLGSLFASFVLLKIAGFHLHVLSA